MVIHISTAVDAPEASVSTSPGNPEEMEEGRKLLMAHPEARSLILARDLDRSEDPAQGVLSIDTSSQSSNNMQADAQMSTPMSERDPDMISSAGWTEERLVNSSTNFRSIPRISAQDPADEVLAKIKEHEDSGIPLIIGCWDKHPRWNSKLFTMDGFAGDGDQIVDARNVRTGEDVKMPLRDLLGNYKEISKSAEPGEKQRFYGKDMPCPPSWIDWLKSDVLPPCILPFGTGDMFSHLPEKDRPETLMCYLGIGDTFTPAHKDLCGSFGHNLMCHTEADGSAFWFMTATGSLHTDAPAMYFQDKLGCELDLESHTATVQELRKAPFDVYVAEQRLGDLVLVPPRSCHQVVNRGGITIKMSWSRMGLKSFKFSLYDELPLYHRVCRLEIYRVKLNIYHAVRAYGQILSDLNSQVIFPTSTRLPLSSCRDTTFSAQTTPQPPSLIEQTSSVLKSLLILFDDILVEEWNPKHMLLEHVSELHSSDPHSCDFCGADIFQSFFKCAECTDDNDEGSAEFICCPACYVEGRSCTCEGGIMEPCQTRPFDNLIRERNNAAGALNIAGRLAWNSRTLNDSPRLHVFEAACKLRLHKKDRTINVPPAKMHRRCTTRLDTDPTHDAQAAHVLNCAGCHSSVCFRHILNLYGVHAAEAVLAHAQDQDQAAWHTLHIAKRRNLLNDHQHSGGSNDSTKRMTWAAWKFKKCRPVDSKRGKEGFYDDYKLVGSNEEEVGDVNEAPEVAAPAAPAAEVIVDDQVAPSIAFLGSDSPLSDLTEDEDDMDVDEESSAKQSRSSSYSPSPSPVPFQKRRPATNPAQAKTPPKKISRLLFDCVLMPSLKKRPAASDVAPTTPTKKARRVEPSPTAPAADISSPSIPRPREIPSNEAFSSPPIQRIRQPTLVPVSPVSAPVRPTVPTAAAPSGPIRRVTEATTRTPPGVNHSRLPEGAAIGRPGKRKVPRPIPLRREPSPERRVIAPLPSFKRKSIPSPVNKSSTTGSSNELRSRLDVESNKVRTLKLELEASREAAAQQTAQRLKLEASLRQTKEEIPKLNAEIREMKRKMDLSASVEQRVAELTKELKDRDEEAEILRRKVEDAKSVISERDRTLGGMHTVLDFVSKSIGTGMQVVSNVVSNAASATSGPMYMQPVAGPSFTRPAEPHMQVIHRGNFSHHGYQGGPGRYRGGINRGRPYRRYSGHVPHYTPNHYQQRDDSHVSRGRSAFPRSGPGIVYERPPPDEGSSFREDISDPRGYYGSDEPSSSRTQHNRGDGGWSNVTARAHHPDYTDHSPTRSRSPSRTREWIEAHPEAQRPRSSVYGRSPSPSQSSSPAATPPRTSRTYNSDSPGHRFDPGEDGGHSPDSRRIAHGDRDYPQDTGYLEDQEHGMDTDDAPHNEGHRDVPSVSQGSANHFEALDNPWQS